jgi:hypothetical protein
MAKKKAKKGGKKKKKKKSSSKKKKLAKRTAGKKKAAKKKTKAANKKKTRPAVPASHTDMTTETASPSPAASARPALNPAAAWPFPTGSRP